jgi:cytochrome c5
MAMREEMDRPVIYQGAESCKECHKKKYTPWGESKHRSVNCETCHGQGKEHIEKAKVESEKEVIVKAVTINRSDELCIKCHLKLPARPHGFKDSPHSQIEPKKHLKEQGERACFKCHSLHYPDIEREEVVEGKKEVVEKAPETIEGLLARIDEITTRIYRKRCASCHGKTGDGKTPKAEELDTPPPDFTSPSYRTTFEQMVNYTRDGKGDEMPSYEGRLSDEEIKALARYIQGFKK